MRNHGRCPPPPLPPPVALRRPFKRNVPGPHITSNAWCSFLEEKFERGGGGMHKFSLWWKIRGIAPQRGCGRHRFFCRQAQRPWSPNHWRCSVRLFSGNLSEGGGYRQISNVAKIRGIATKIRNNQMFFCRRPHPSDVRSGTINPLATSLAMPCARWW
jgi:hypothetical protein